jgi:hypothetical protein
MKLLPDWIKNYRIDIYKDLVFWPIATLWLIGNIIEFYYTHAAIWVNQGFILIMCILIYIKETNKKFNNWLNTPLDKNERYKYKRKRIS